MSWTEERGPLAGCGTRFIVATSEQLHLNGSSTKHSFNYEFKLLEGRAEPGLQFLRWHGAFPHPPWKHHALATS